MARKEIKINREEFEHLCEIQCSSSELALYYRCSRDTIEKWVKNHYTDQDGNPATFTDVVKHFSIVGKIALRRTSMEMATVERNPTMVIWNCKQYLGQSENPNATQAEMPTINFNVTRRSEQVREKLKEQATTKEIEYDPWDEID